MIQVFGPKDRHLFRPDYINTTSSSKNWTIELSPFLLGPVDLYDGMIARRMENAWQFCKVYPEHIDAEGNPTEKYWVWAKDGWATERGIRYPMGKGAKPLYSLWKGEHLPYVEARKRIYVPLYASLVQKTEAFQKLKEMQVKGEDIYLWDFDGYDNVKAGMTYQDVIDCPTKTMGHAFVIAMLLENQICWQ